MTTFCERLPGYAIEEEIARTDRTLIYRAVDRTSGETVAAKLVRNDAYGRHEVEMLRRVARANPAGPAHVMRLLGAYEEGDELWLALEFFHSTVEDLEAREMTPLALMNIAADAAKGLLEMERAGIVDDDVKPGNIAFKFGSGRVAHLDLGCARVAGRKPIGYTEDYVAPEVEQGQASDTSPCYGWARTMEYLSMGKIGAGPDYLLCDFVPWVGRGFSKVVARCCREDPSERPSVREMCEAVKREVLARRRCRRCNAIAFRDGACPNCGG